MTRIRLLLAIELLVAVSSLMGGCGGSVQVETELVELPPADPRAVRLFVEGTRLMDRPGQQRAARQRFVQALQIDEHLWEAHYNLGVMDRRAGRMMPAINHFSEARRIQPGASEPLLALAEAYYVVGERDQAADLLQQVIHQDPNYVPARVALATILRERGRYRGALEQAREALIREPSNVRALTEVGRVYRSREQYDVAELVLRKALDLAADNAVERAEILNDLGLLELARGDTQAAFTHFASAIEADPQNTPAHKNQGSVLLQAGDYEGAAAEYRAVLRVDDDDLDAHVALGICLRGLGQNRQAQREYEQVLEAAPNNVEALYNLAILKAEFLNQRPQSVELFRRFLEAAPRSHPKREEAQRYIREIGGPGGGGGGGG